jgi:hypothetical protein
MTIPQKGQALKPRRGALTIEFSRAEPGAPVLVNITDAHGQSDYWVDRLPSDWGVAARFRKIWCGRASDFDSAVYDVLLDTRCWLHTCECQGHLRHGTDCRHIRAAVKLFDAGLLVQPPRPEHAPERPARMEPVPVAAAGQACHCFECGRPSDDFYCDRCGGI